MQSVVTVAVGVILGAVVSASPMRGQSVPCDSVVAHVLLDPTNQDTVALVRKCSNWGTTMATLLERYSLASDTATYGFLFDIAGLYREPETFSAAKAIAADGGAPAFARISSLLLLANYASPDGVDIQRKMFVTYSGNPTGGCFLAPSGLVQDGTGTMPSDFVSQSLTLSRTVLNDGTAPTGVRFAASCLHWLAVGDTIPTGVVVDFSFNPATQFRLITQCGSNFVMRNYTPGPVAVYIEPNASDTPGSGWTTLPPRVSGVGYSDVPVHFPATIVIKYGGVIIASAANNATPC
jgi:hypothetical protein